MRLVATPPRIGSVPDDAVQRVAESAVTLSVDVEAVHAGHIRHQVHRHPGVALHDGQSVHLASGEYRAGSGGGGFQQRRCRRHLDPLHDIADGELHVERKRVIGAQHDFGAL